MARADSIEFARETAQSLAEGLPVPPRKLSPDAAEFWATVIGSKRLAAWTDSDLILACSLARDLALAEKLSQQLDAEGHTLVNEDSGRVYAHPAAAMLDQANRRILSTIRSLQIHSLATNGRAEQQPAKNATAKQMAERNNNAGDLIARPLRVV